jgi:uncharacterized protein
MDMKVGFVKAMLTGAMMVALTAGATRADDPVAQIVVTGEGRVEARPDMATVSLGVTTEAETAVDAMQQNSTRMAEVLAQLREAGIEERDLQTSGLSLGPRWDYGSGTREPRLVGFTATNTLSVRVRDLEALGGILDRSVRDGANTFNGLTFGLIEPQPVMDEARRRAVADARRKAELYAEAAGVTLGPILMLTESGGMAPPQPIMRMAAAEMSDAAVPVAQGEVNLTASVSITWRLGD